MRPALPRRPFLYPLIDVRAGGEEEALAALVTLARTGVKLIQIRAKTLSDRSLVVLAREAVLVAHGLGAQIVINDRPDVTKIAGADGVHLGQDDLPPNEARALLGPDAIIGFSTHSLLQLEAASGAPIDYVALGPIFSTRNKLRPDPVVGPEMIAQGRRVTALPLVVIGGISRTNARQAVQQGADGLAVIGDLFEAPDLGEAVRQFERAMAP